MQTTNTTTHLQRTGRFTSGNIARLMSLGRDNISFGKPAFTYIAEKNMERRLGRTLATGTDTRPIAWGRVLQHRAFQLLGAGYWFNMQTIAHPVHGSFWAGTPDMQKFDTGATVVEVKCPFTMKSFCQLADCTNIDEVREEHPDGETYYWQLVSNAILTGAQHAELVAYCPYRSELPAIRKHAPAADTGACKTNWISAATDDELPWLPDGGYYKNLHIIRFAIDDTDRQLLTEKVIEASNLLV